METVPEYWNETKAAIIEASDSLFSEFSTDDLRNFIVYVDDKNGNHLFNRNKREGVLRCVQRVYRQ